jgi:hypothetical protein
MKLAGLLAVTFLLVLRGGTAAGETEAERGLEPLITTSELAVGENRFAFGLLQGNRFLENAAVGLRLYSLDGQEARLARELSAPYHSLQKMKDEPFLHRHPDGKRHAHQEDPDVRGLYVAQVSFPRPGSWGVEIFAHERSRFDAARVKVTVLDSPATPLRGSPAPRNRNLIQGKPQIVLFATPRFCPSRMCGPVMNIVRKSLSPYGDRVVFIHQEIWQDFAAQKLFPAVEEWRLRTEPWIFIVDARGIVRAKFEGLVTSRELEAALEETMPRGTARRR